MVDIYLYLTAKILKIHKTLSNSVYFTVRLGIYDQIFHWGFDTKINSHLISVRVWFISYRVSMTHYITSYIAVQVLKFKKMITKFFLFAL